MRDETTKAIDEAVDKAGVNRYVLVHVIAKRAKYIKDTTQPDTEKSYKPVLQSLREIVHENALSQFAEDHT